MSAAAEGLGAGDGVSAHDLQLRRLSVQLKIPDFLGPRQQAHDGRVGEAGRPPLTKSTPIVEM